MNLFCSTKHLFISIFGIFLTLTPLTNQACTLRVGWEQWRPYVFSAHGQLSGREYQLLQNLAQKTQCKLEFIESPWARSLIQLKNDQLDLLYGASLTAEREQFAQFSKAYRIEQMVLVELGSGLGAPRSFSLWLKEPRPDGKPKVLGVIRSYNYGVDLEPILNQEQTHYVRHEVRFDSQLRDMLASRRIDGYLIEAQVGQWQQHSIQAPLRLSPLTEVKGEKMHLMFSKRVPKEIVIRFNQAIEQQMQAP